MASYSHYLRVLFTQLLFFYQHVSSSVCISVGYLLSLRSFKLSPAGRGQMQDGYHAVVNVDE